SPAHLEGFAEVHGFADRAGGSANALVVQSSACVFRRAAVQLLAAAAPQQLEPVQARPSPRSNALPAARASQKELCNVRAWSNVLRFHKRREHGPLNCDRRPGLPRPPCRNWKILPWVRPCLLHSSRRSYRRDWPPAPHYRLELLRFHLRASCE